MFHTLVYNKEIQNSANSASTLAYIDITQYLKETIDKDKH